MEHKKLIVGVLVLLLAARVAGVSAAPRDANGAPSRDVQELAQEVPGWQQVNSNGFGVQQAGEVSAVGAFDGQLYAGTHNAMDGARIFRSPDGVTWTPVTQPGFGISHDIAPPAILDLTVFNGRLYASTGRGDGPAQIWRTLNGVAWAPMVITGFSDPDTVDVTALVEYNGLLYAGATNLINGAQIWRSYTGDNNTWAQVAPAAPGTAPASVTGLAVFDGALYAAIESEAPAQIWRSYGGDWTTVVSDGFGNNETTSTGGTAEFAGYLYVGAGNARDGAQLWRTHDGVNWTQAISPGFGDSNNQKVEMVFVFQNHLYASAKNTRTGIELWRSTDGSLWERANLDGFGDSNNSGTNWSNATAEFLGHLYVGTSNVVEGGELWQMQGHEADLALSKADALDPVEVGTPLTYTLTVSNSGPSAATEVTVTDELPAGIVYGSVSGSGWNCGHQGGVVTCTLPTLAVGAAPDILITVIAPERAGTVTNTALIAAATFDPHLANNTDSESTRIQEAGT